MKRIHLLLLLPITLLAWGGIAAAQPSNPVAPGIANAPAPDSDARDQATYEKHTRPVMNALKLEDADKAAKVHDIMVAQFAALRSWHATNDARIKDLWNQFNKARAAQNQTNADQIMSQIDSAYATFKPQHEAFIAKLADVITPEQIETIEDAITINKVEITYRAYGEIFSGLTDKQKAFILENLKAARKEAVDAGSMPEISAFFKKYKIKIEAYLTAQGYDVKQAYRDFVAKQKAEAAAKKTSATPGDNNSAEK